MKRVFLSFYVFIVFSMLFVQFGLGPIIDKVAELYLHESVIEYYRKLSQGVFYMMEQDLLRLPKEMWSERIKELKPQFGYNISLLPYYELDLPQEQLTQLRQSKIAMAEEGDFLYRQVGNSEMVIEKGPLLVLEPNSRFLTLATWIAIIVIYALLTFIWIIPYCWKLRKISGAATAFGNGNFNIRVDISKRSSLTSIAQAFNTMAKRIQQLIDSHKELTNAVSHELRTPLSRLRFGLEMLETAENQEKRSHYARGLQTDVTELEDLVSELLTFARFDREKPDLQFDVHHLDSFLRQLLAESVPDESDIRYQLHCHLQELSGLVCFEPKYLARAIGNLIQNALCYTNHQVQIIVERNEDECCIHVDDDGPGIPPADRQRVFEPFVRLDASRSRMSGGYGLGLAIVSRILEWHDGRIAVTDSQLGGARFSVCWPGYR